MSMKELKTLKILAKRQGLKFESMTNKEVALFIKSVKL